MRARPRRQTADRGAHTDGGSGAAEGDEAPPLGDAYGEGRVLRGCILAVVAYQTAPVTRATSCNQLVPILCLTDDRESRFGAANHGPKTLHSAQIYAFSAGPALGNAVSRRIASPNGRMRGPFAAKKHALDVVLPPVHGRHRVLRGRI